MHEPCRSCGLFQRPCDCEVHNMRLNQQPNKPDCEECKELRKRVEELENMVKELDEKLSDTIRFFKYKIDAAKPLILD